MMHSSDLGILESRNANPVSLSLPYICAVSNALYPTSTVSIEARSWFPVSRNVPNAQNFSEIKGSFLAFL